MHPKGIEQKYYAFLRRIRPWAQLMFGLAWLGQLILYGGISLFGPQDPSYNRVGSFFLILLVSLTCWIIGNWLIVHNCQEKSNWLENPIDISFNTLRDASVWLRARIFN